MKKGFTLVEILVVVLIIGVLAAIALPMYQKAVLKSRFAALMPIGKSIADSNEAYYLEHGQYAAHPQDLPVQGQEDYPEGTSVDLVSDDDYAYTMVYNETKLPDHNYLAFQKHSPKFAGTTMCEARDEEAGKVCLALGGTDLGGGVTENWTAYLLSGDASGSNFCPTGATCDENGNITECPSGKTPKAGKCAACDIENAVSCSTTSYAATSCNEGYNINNAGVCEADPNYPKLQALKNAHCPSYRPYLVCTIKNGKLYKCDTHYGKIDEETGECVTNGTAGQRYEYILDADGKQVGSYMCFKASSGHCNEVHNEMSTGNETKVTWRVCANNGEISKEGVCANGYDNSSNNADKITDSRGNTISNFVCSPADISPTTGKCDKYRFLTTYDNSYNNPRDQRSYVEKVCPTAPANPTAECSNYKPVYSVQYNETGLEYKTVACFGSSNNNGNALPWYGTSCENGKSLKSYDSATGQYTSCTNGVNWETATCK